MKTSNLTLLENLATQVNDQIKGMDRAAKKDVKRAYGGFVRSGKGGLVESLCRELVKIAWNELDGDEGALSFSTKKIPIPLRKEYLSRIQSPEIKDWIQSDYKNFVFKAKVDVHVFIQNEFALGIECKTFTENAMFKRILLDFTLLKKAYPGLRCALLQLESQLTGDYSQIHNKITLGSRSTHTLMSYFDVDLNIMTLMEGERKVNQPIHQEKYFKSIEINAMVKTVEKLKELLKPF